MKEIYIDNDNIAKIKGLNDGFGNYINHSTVYLTIKRKEDNSLIYENQMVAENDNEKGNYHLKIPYDIDLDEKTYWLKLTSYYAGEKGTWEGPLNAIIRRFDD